MESCDWAFDAYREGAVFTAFDIETTGLDPKQDRIVEFGAVKFDRRGPVCRYSTLIDPGIPMPEAAARVNGITSAMLAGQPSLEQVFPDFLSVINGTIIIAHNAPFDTGFVNEGLRILYGAGQKHGGRGSLLPGMEDEAGPAWTPPFPGLPNRVADTLALARRLFPDRGGHKLQELAAALDLDVKKAHRAEDDARICMELFIRMAELVKGRADMLHSG